MIDLDQLDSAPRYLRIASRLRERILAGEFGESGRLPTTRALARELEVNRQTVVAAYAKLGEWGYARAHVGRGTFALRPQPPRGPSAPASAPSRRRRELRGARAVPELPAAGSTAPWSGFFSRATDGWRAARLSTVSPAAPPPGVISFAGSFPALELLPLAGFRQAMEKVLRETSGKSLTYGPAQGSPILREWIAGEMTERGMPTTGEEVLITNGSQHAIDLVARAFIDPGDVVMLENPTYSGAISAFESFGARLSGLPMDGAGVLPGAIEALASRQAAKLLYLTPSFQNPTSTDLPPERRHQVIRHAAAANLLIVEDDWASGLRYEGEDRPTLRSMDAEGRVIYLSTFAKILLPGLRIGWISAARPIIERLAVLKQINDFCTSPLLQAALARFCRGGGLGRHLARVRQAYRLRRDRMLAAMERHFPSGAIWSRPAGGLFIWVALPEPIDSGAVQHEAADRGVLVSGGDPFYIEGSGPCALRLAFASSKPKEIEAGIKIVGSILKRHMSSGAKSRPKVPAEAVPLV